MRCISSLPAIEEFFRCFSTFRWVFLLKWFFEEGDCKTVVVDGLMPPWEDFEVDNQELADEVCKQIMSLPKV